MGGKVSLASLKRRVIASGVIAKNLIVVLFF
jgi:hypothetical protein